MRAALASLGDSASAVPVLANSRLTSASPLQLVLTLQHSESTSASNAGSKQSGPIGPTCFPPRER